MSPWPARFVRTGFLRAELGRRSIAMSRELRTANCLYVGVAATVTGCAASAGRISSAGHTYTASRRE